jgi:hypothetical protein
MPATGPDAGLEPAVCFLRDIGPQPSPTNTLLSVPGPKGTSYPNPTTQYPANSGDWSDTDSNRELPGLQPSAVPFGYRSRVLSVGIEPTTTDSKGRHPSPTGTPRARRAQSDPKALLVAPRVRESQYALDTASPAPGRGLEPLTTGVTVRFPHHGGLPGTREGRAGFEPTLCLD